MLAALLPSSPGKDSWLTRRSSQGVASPSPLLARPMQIQPTPSLPTAILSAKAGHLLTKLALSLQICSSTSSKPNILSTSSDHSPSTPAVTLPTTLLIIPMSCLMSSLPSAAPTCWQFSCVRSSAKPTRTLPTFSSSPQPLQCTSLTS